MSERAIYTTELADAKPELLEANTSADVRQQQPEADTLADVKQEPLKANQGENLPAILVSETAKQMEVEKDSSVSDQDQQAEIVAPGSILPAPRQIFHTKIGQIYCGDSLQMLNDMNIIKPGSVNLIMTSPPFGLVRKKEYGNVDADKYVEWFRPFAEAFYHALSDNGSLVIDIGGSWIPGLPTRSLYHFELLIMLCREFKFHLAQEFLWWNPSKLPTPAEWVNIRRIRVKDAINYVWWLSKTPWPKASNTRVLQPYSDSMLGLLKNGYKAKMRPSGHDISTKFSIDNGAAIPPNILAIPNTESNSAYLRYCAEKQLPAHPARYPAVLPEYFIRMLTEPADLVVDPFAGSCVTGEVAERLARSWVCSELREDYVEGALGRFALNDKPTSSNGSYEKFYKLARPGLLWGEIKDVPLPENGGKTRLTKLPLPDPHSKENSNDTETAESEATEKSSKNGASVTHSKKSKKRASKKEQNQDSLW